MHNKKELGDMFYDVEVGLLGCQIEIETREVLNSKGDWRSKHNGHVTT